MKTTKKNHLARRLAFGPRRDEIAPMLVVDSEACTTFLAVTIFENVTM